jgi:hypothetical protein
VLDRPQIVTAYVTHKELDNYKTRRRENRRLPKNPKFPETTRMILKATQISKKETTTQKTKLFSLQIQMLQNLQESQLAQGRPTSQTIIFMTIRL